jgi:hypothetical protein
MRNATGRNTYINEKVKVLIVLHDHLDDKMLQLVTIQYTQVRSQIDGVGFL